MTVRFRSRRICFTHEFEMEYGKKTVVYEADVEVSPYTPAKTSGPPEDCYPAEGGEVESVEVYYVTQQKINGKTVTIRERRPELDDVLDEDELLEAVPEPDFPDHDRDDE